MIEGREGKRNREGRGKRLEEGREWGWISEEEEERKGRRERGRDERRIGRGKRKGLGEGRQLNKI